MKILALDSSQIRAAVVVFQILPSKQGQLYYGATASTAVSASESLLPLIHEVLEKSHIQLSEIDAFAVGVGPGSFTGIRIGLVTAKTLAQVHNKPMIAVSSLQALAFSAESTPHSETVAMANAYQGQVFVGWHHNHQWYEVAMPPQAWCEQNSQSKGSQNLQLVGSGVAAYEAVLKDFCQKHPQWQLQPALSTTPTGLMQIILDLVHQHSDIKKVFSSYLQVQARYLRPAQATLNLEKHLSECYRKQ